MWVSVAAVAFHMDHIDFRLVVVVFVVADAGFEVLHGGATLRKNSVELLWGPLKRTGVYPGPPLRIHAGFPERSAPFRPFHSLKSLNPAYGARTHSYGA